MPALQPVGLNRERGGHLDGREDKKGRGSFERRELERTMWFPPLYDAASHRFHDRCGARPNSHAQWEPPLLVR